MDEFAEYGFKESRLSPICAETQAVVEDSSLGWEWSLLCFFFFSFLSSDCKLLEDVINRVIDP